MLSQEDLDVFMSGVALQNEHHHAIVPQISFTSEPLERKILQKIPSNRQVSKLEKPIGRGPFPCELCVNLPGVGLRRQWISQKVFPTFDINFNVYLMIEFQKYAMNWNPNMAFWGQRPEARQKSTAIWVKLVVLF